MQNKLFPILLFFVSLFLLLDAFTNLFTPYIIFRKIFSLLVLGTAGILIYFILINKKQK